MQGKSRPVRVRLWRSRRGLQPLQKLSHRDDGNTLVLAQVEQVAITADDEVCLARSSKSYSLYERID